MKEGREYPADTLRICINHRSAVDNEVSGLVCSAVLEDNLFFSDKIEFVLKVDEAYNQIGRPQPQQVLRSFQDDDTPRYNSYIGSHERCNTSEEILAHSGSEATYDLVMTSRKYAEWQGILKNEDGTVKGRFESVLECLSLL